MGGRYCGASGGLAPALDEAIALVSGFWAQLGLMGSRLGLRAAHPGR
jgi:hypothetical protein